MKETKKAMKETKKYDKNGVRKPRAVEARPSQDKVALEAAQWLKIGSRLRRNVKRYARMRTDETRVAAACRLLGLKSDRFSRRAVEDDLELKWSKLQLAKWEECEADCLRVGEPEDSESRREHLRNLMRVDLMAVWMQKYMPRENHGGRLLQSQPEAGGRPQLGQNERETHWLKVQRTKERSKRRRRIAATLPASEPVDTSDIMEESAPRLIARELAAIRSLLDGLNHELGQCDDFQNCAASSAFADTLGGWMQRVREDPRLGTVKVQGGTPCCARCRKIVLESDRLKADLKDLAPGLFAGLRLSGIARPAGRPKKDAGTSPANTI